MRRALLALAVAVAMIGWAPGGTAFAQVGGGNLGSDPFSLYYGYYLPHQAAIAAQPTPMDTINQNIAQRARSPAQSRSLLALRPNLAVRG